MTLANNSQKSLIAIMLDKLGLKAQKENLVLGFTNDRTTTTTEMSMEEAKAMIRYLKEQDPEEQDAKKMRRKIWAMCHHMGWHKPGTKQVNSERLDEWCVKYGKFKKPFDKHVNSELPQLVTQFKAAHFAHLKAF